MTRSAITIRLEDPLWPTGNWDRLSHYLNLALAESPEVPDWTLQHIYDAVLADRVTLWGVYYQELLVGAAVTSFMRYPARLVLEVIYAASDPHADVWRDAMSQMVDFAKAHGATQLSGTGRVGWSRAIGATRERRVWEVDL
jgi:hypothetical protein